VNAKEDLAGRSVLVANRGEIARRIIRGAQALGMRAIAVHTDEDRGLPYVTEADQSFELGASALRSPYLDEAMILDAARATGADSIHPGYGFMSERSSFAVATAAAGVLWVGPTASAIDQMGDKVRAKALMRAAGVPVLPGSDGPITALADARAVADRIGYPVMVKASAGGGGMGIVIARDVEQLETGFASAQARAERLFGDPAMLVERYVEYARHIEVQIFGRTGVGVLALGDRDCSVQRRHQKVVEEAPSPYVTAELRDALEAAAVIAGEAIDYRSAGTVEFVVDTDTGEFYFLEVNTRLQVEHPITECVTGIDIVAEQLKEAFGIDSDALSGRPVEMAGHAIELRVYAEDSERFLPSPGQISRWVEPDGPGIRVDAGYVEGNTVSRSFDPLLAKVVVHDADRERALELAREAVDGFKIEGVRTNLDFLRRLLSYEPFTSGHYTTGVVSSLIGAKTI
jgi:acetyl-CoA carboxylase biotin carboxylase subunit